MTARGIRLHNPFNIRELKGDRTYWVGERATDDDPQFEEFDHEIYGIRAGVKILLNYQRLYGLMTIRGIMNRFAPPSENDTESYIAHLAGAMHVDPDEAIDLRYAPAALNAMARCIIRHENGYNPYHVAIIEAGIALAMQ